MEIISEKKEKITSICHKKTKLLGHTDNEGPQWVWIKSFDGSNKTVQGRYMETWASKSQMNREEVFMNWIGLGSVTEFKAYSISSSSVTLPILWHFLSLSSS